MQHRCRASATQFGTSPLEMGLQLGRGGLRFRPRRWRILQTLDLGLTAGVDRQLRQASRSLAQIESESNGGVSSNTNRIPLGFHT